MPVLYKGRFRPAEAYGRLWLYDMYGSQSFKAAHRETFDSPTGSALPFLWRLSIHGFHSFAAKPLFLVRSAKLKEWLQLDRSRQQFSYQELDQALYENPPASRELFEKLLAHYLLSSSPLALHSQSKLIELINWMPGLWIERQGSMLQLVNMPASRWPVKEKDWFSLNAFNKGKETNPINEAIELIQRLQQFALIKGLSSQQKELENSFQRLIEQQASPKEISQALDRQFPLIQQLRAAGPLWKALPGRYQPGEWFSLDALLIRVYNAKQNRLIPVSNFTLFSNADFQDIQKSYIAWEQATLANHDPSALSDLHARLLTHLDRAFDSIEKQIYQEAEGKALTYPSKRQLRLEAFYYQSSLIPFVIGIYGLALFIFLIGYRASSSFLNQTGLWLLGLAFFSHTLVMLIRCYILERPPVSNMFETALYVPWVTVLTGFILKGFFHHRLILIASSTASLILLIILQLTELNASLDNAQAVLDSQFWLIIHVLMVVGSYGVFLLGSLASHFYLGKLAYSHHETASMKTLIKCVLQTCYVGTALLIAGTILGGIWAAESWGRFWDWDPKESWAFISSCLYLIWIHAHRFHKIGDLGVAIGAIIGFLAISFTWYGVNYILGTGLHSYGFGSGGEGLYYGFLCADIGFLSLCCWLIYAHRTKNQPTSSSGIKLFGKGNYFKEL